jgi:hypothetical protein
MIEPETIKKELLQACHQLVDQRIANAQSAMSAAQESANTEEKSSAGDKYETGRAMAQLERDKAALQVNECLRLKQSLNRVNVNTGNEQVTTGSLVLTDKNHFFIAISLGKMVIAKTDYLVIAPATPVGKLLIGAIVGSTFSFNHQIHTIQEIL